MVAGTVTTVPVDVVNQTDVPLATVPPRPVKLGARWRRLDEHSALANPLVPLPRVLPPGTRTAVEVPLEVPDEPGRYEVRVALRQHGLGWFGARLQAEVAVVASAGLGPQGGEEDDVADGGAVGEEHDEAVHADAEPARGG
jgi:hypothetical protein